MMALFMDWDILTAASREKGKTMAQLLFNYGGVILAIILELGLFYVLFLAKRPPRHRTVLSLAALLAVWVGPAAFCAFFDHPGLGKGVAVLAVLAVCGGTTLLVLSQTYLPFQEDGKPTDELRTVLELEVDLLQGCLLTRPAVIPDPVPQEVVDLIREVQGAKAET